MVGPSRYAVQFELINLKGRRQLLVLGKALTDGEGKHELDRQIEEIDRGIENLRESSI
jgi:hypothetical protein